MPTADLVVHQSPEVQKPQWLPAFQLHHDLQTDQPIQEVQALPGVRYCQAIRTFPAVQAGLGFQGFLSLQDFQAGLEFQ